MMVNESLAADSFKANLEHRCVIHSLIIQLFPYLSSSAHSGGDSHDGGDQQHTATAAASTSATAAAAVLHDSAIISFGPMRYTRDQLMSMRCVSLVRPRPQYIEDGILARKSWCRYADLVANAPPGSMPDGPETGGGGSGRLHKRSESSATGSAAGGGDAGAAGDADGGGGGGGGGGGRGGGVKRGGQATQVGKAVGLSRFQRSEVRAADAAGADGGGGAEKGGPKAGGGSSGGGPRRSMAWTGGEFLAVPVHID